MLEGFSLDQTAQRPERSGSARRRHVIDVAAATFARLGYHGAGTREIAETLGIKVASLYFHVASKEQALEEVCVRGINSTLEAILAATSAAPDLPSRLEYFFARQRENLRQHCDYITVYTHERRHLPPEALHRLELISRRFRDELDRMFGEAARRGELHQTLSPRSGSLIMIGTIRNLTQFYVDGPIRSFDEFAEHAVAALIRGVTGSSKDDS